MLYKLKAALQLPSFGVNIFRGIVYVCVGAGGIP